MDVHLQSPLDVDDAVIWLWLGVFGQSFFQSYLHLHLVIRMPVDGRLQLLVDFHVDFYTVGDRCIVRDFRSVQKCLVLSEIFSFRFNAIEPIRVHHRHLAGQMIFFRESQERFKLVLAK